MAKKKQDKPDKQDVIKEIAEKLLANLLIDGSISIHEDTEGTVHVDVDTQETGLIIGYHGETLNSFQLIVGLMVYQRLGEWTRVVVNVADYRQKREEAVKSLALRVAQEVTLTKQPTPLPYLAAYERRIVHMTLASHPDVLSLSEGEGKERRIIIKPKEQ